jgi:FkbM family methyltransferase
MKYSNLIIIILNFFDYFQKKKIIKLINKKFKYPITVFDIGAHHGETIKLFIKNLNIKKIYSFEASPKNFLLMKENIKVYKKKVEIYNFGLGDKISNSYIHQTQESSSSTINEINKDSRYFKRKLKILNIKNKNLFSYKLPIQLYTLDYFIEKNKIENVDLIKIDTEGYEFNILKGLSKYNKKIKLIYFEHHYDDMILKNYKFKDIHHLLKDMNFKMIQKSKMVFRKSFEYVYENQENKFFKTIY